MDPAAPRQHITAWTLVTCAFLGAALLALLLLVLPEWSRAGVCEGACDGTTSPTVWWGLGLALLAALCALITLTYLIISATSPDARIDAYIMADAAADTLPAFSPVIVREVARAQERPAPSVFDRWVRA